MKTQDSELTDTKCRACSTHGREGECIKSFGEKAGRKRPTERSIRRWKNNIKIDLCGGGVDYMRLTQDRDQWLALVNTVMNLRVP
jgi:hypothetical protein